jgi:acyl-CoA thioesterase YciA
MAESREPTLRVTMLPRDTNARGTIFGGVILSHIDLAGAIAAYRQAMREVGFISPVFVGDVVSFYTQVLGEGRTSVTVQVTVEAERSREPRQYIKVTQAGVIYAAVDEAGNPIPLR